MASSSSSFDSGRAVHQLRHDLPAEAIAVDQQAIIGPRATPARRLSTGRRESAVDSSRALSLARDARRNWRITLECSWLRLLPGRERRTTEEVRREAERAIEVLTDLGDDRTEMRFEQRGGGLSAEGYGRAAQGWSGFFDRMAERLPDA